MEIGDKIYFDKYLPLDETGKFKDIRYPVEILSIPLDGNGMSSSTISLRKVPKYIITHNDPNIVTYKTVKLNTTELKSGKFLGTFRKKLERSYRTDATQAVEQNRMPPEPIRGSRVRPFRTVDRYSNNSRRLDNPRSLSTLAIIATSTRKRYIVDMEDVHRLNIDKRLKII